MRAIVVGAGSTARALLRRMGGRWETTVVDTDVARLALAADTRSVESILGEPDDEDVLERAGLGRAAVLVAAAADDDLNLRVCHLARARGVPCTALAADPERLAEYRARDVTAVSADRLAARRLISVLEPRRLFSAGFAADLAEGMDLRVVSRSPVCGRPLREIDMHGWLAVAIVRAGRLIIPHGDSVIEEDDVITVVGDGANRAEVLVTFTSGVERFPTEYGQWVAVAVGRPEDLEGPVAEALHIARHSAASGLLLLHRHPDTIVDPAARARIRNLVAAAQEAAGEVPLRLLAVDGDPGAALLTELPGEDVGVVVVEAVNGSRLAWRRRVSQLLRFVGYRGIPLLMSRSTHPYRKVVAPARESHSAEAAAEVAIDLAAYEQAPLTAIAVVPPVFIAGDEARDDAVRAVVRLEDDAAVHGVDVRPVVRQGNEVRLIESCADAYTLIVLGVRRRRLISVTPGIAGHLLRRSVSSVLVVPGGR